MPKLIKYDLRDPIGTGTFPLPNNKVNHAELKKRLCISRTDKFKDTSVLYIHIPFCNSICSFCALNRVVGNEELKEMYLHALEKEMQCYGSTPYIQSLTISAIYLGGGSPTCLSPAQLNRVLEWTHKYFNIHSDCEITCEGTIQGFTDEMTGMLKSKKVTRASAGIQSFNGWLRKNHLNMMYEKEEVLELIMHLKSKFDNFNIDLIYNLPKQTDEIWVDDLETAIKIVQPNHLTLNPYVLLRTTKIYNEVAKETYVMPDMDREIAMFDTALNMLEGSQLQHQYSVRDWAIKDNYCRYIVLNSYSNDVIGLGAGGYGYISGCTYKNYYSLEDYNRLLLEENLVPIEKDYLCTDTEKMQRYMVMGMRLQHLQMAPFTERFGVDWREMFGELLKDLEYSGFIKIDGDDIYTTRQGVVWGNNIRAEFADIDKFTFVGYGLIGAGKSGRGNYL